MSSKQPRKQRLAHYTAPYHRRHREMSSPIDKGLRERQLSRGFMYPRAMPVKKGDRVMIVRGEGKSKSATAVSLVDRKARKVYVEGFTYFKSDGTELQRPIDASNLVIINPDWSDIRRRKILNRINESVDWTDDVISDLEAAEDEYEAEEGAWDEKQIKAVVWPAFEAAIAAAPSSTARYEILKVIKIKIFIDSIIFRKLVEIGLWVGFGPIWDSETSSA